MITKEPPLTMTVTAAARLLGIGRNQMYDAAKRGDVPSVQIGRRVLILRAPLLRMCGVDVPPPTDAGAQDAQADPQPAAETNPGPLAAQFPRR